MKIAVIGTGYVGLVSGVMMAHLGHQVTCFDIDASKITTLKQKQSPIFETGLQEYLELYANSPRLNFSCDYNHELSDAQLVFITVGTPPKEDGSAELSGIFAATRAILPYLSPKCVVVVKSTVPPGTCLQLQEMIYSIGHKNAVISNPEFLREGVAVHDFLHPDRIIIGAQEDTSFALMRQLYDSFAKRPEPVPIFESDLTTAELIKYAANSFLANKIAFINEMSDLCEKLGANVVQLSKGIGSDKRIGQSFLNPGPGFGGSCFPKDILALQYVINQVGSKSLLLDAIIESNNQRSYNMYRKIAQALGGSVSGKRIAALGLTYKAGTDDLRSSPAIKLVQLLQQQGAIIIAYDPYGMGNLPLYPDLDIACADSALVALQDSDAMLILTEWPEFNEIDLIKAKSIMRLAVIIDLRNLLDGLKAQKAGFEYHSLGRQVINHRD